MVEQSAETPQTDQTAVQTEPTIQFHVNGMRSSLPVSQVREKLLSWNADALAATYKEAAKNHPFATALFGLKAALAAMTPVLRLMTDATRKNSDVSAWVRDLMLPVPTPPRHTDMLGFLCSYLIESVVHIAASGTWTLNVSPVPVNEDGDEVRWTVTDFKVTFKGNDKGNDNGDVGPAR